MALKIISGLARGIVLETPEGRSMRPTSGKGREALFSSIGTLAGRSFADIFAGSGAVGLEAASRGASEVVLLESDARHVRLMERNLEKLRKAGVEAPVSILRRHATPGALLALPRCDIWFFDPPYADSARYFREYLTDPALLEHLRDAEIIWELPDTPAAAAGFQTALEVNRNLESRLKTLGGVDFLWSRIPR